MFLSDPPRSCAENVRFQHRPRIRAMAAMLALAAAGAAAQQPAEPTGSHAEHEDSHAKELETIEVRALPLAGSALDSAQPVSILAGERLDDHKAATLGETLKNEPGIHSTYFGPGAGRPVVRGLGGTRVRITEDGLNSLDASALSPDHGVSAEPLLIDRIEVIRGPANLLYGSSASAGVVNLIDNRIPEQRQDWSARVELRGNSVADEFASVGRIDGGIGAVQFHFDGFYRDTGNFEIPGFALSEAARAGLDPEPRAEQSRGTLDNSAVETEGGTLGTSWVDDWGFVGFAFKRYDSTYGIPADLEEEEETLPGIAGDQVEEESGISIDLEQQRWEVKSALYDPLPAIREVNFKFSTNDYQHVELEGADVGTTFNIDGREIRSEIKHAPFAGFNGVLGFQHEDTDLEAIGAEAFIPPGSSESLGIFVMEEYALDPVTLSAGFRWQNDEVALTDGRAKAGIDRRDFTAISISAAAIWRIGEAWQARLNWQRAERSPTQEELFADGPHVATQAFEIGDPTLGEETSNNLDFGLHYDLGGLHLSADFFYNDIDDFVFLANTPDIEDGLPVQLWSQTDARFYGTEIQAEYRFATTPVGDFELRGFFDSVEADIDAGNGEVPRISPWRIGAELDWHYGNLRANLGYTRILEVDDPAAFETRTAGYNALSANLAWWFRLQRTEVELFLKGENLSDETQRVHTSFLKDFAPRPGINITGGIRTRF